MTNVLHHHIDFQPRPVSHAPSPFGFGFGLGSAPSLNPVASSSWGTPSTPGHTNVAAFQQLASSINQSAMRSSKRRHDSDEEYEHQSRDESMDRSPTPERPKRAAPKRARMVPTNSATDKENAGPSENTANASQSQDEVDVGVLLASLPSESLLPLLMNLLKTHPALKSDVLSLIPKPTLESALQAIDKASGKLRAAYPYSATPSNSLSFGFGSSLATPTSQPTQGGMRDSYIISRIQPKLNDFVSCCISYLPYFTSNRPSDARLQSAGPQLSQAIQSMHRSHPGETFAFLSGVLNQVMSQPPLAISSIAQLLLPRLVGEWHSWVDNIDTIVNKEGRMFGSETVRGWERVLDELAGTRAVEISTAMRPVRDKWVAKVGWLLGRHAPQAMDEH